MISRWIFVRMRNVSVKIVENIKTHILCSITFFFENCAVYETMWKKYGTARQAADDDITLHMRFAFWINTAMLLLGKEMPTRMRLNLKFICTLPLLFPCGIYVWNSPTLCLHSSPLPSVLHSSPSHSTWFACPNAMWPHGGDHKIHRNATLSATSVLTFRRNMCTDV